MSETALKRIIEKIKQAKTFLVSAHVGLEGDALGAELAAYILLKKLKKKVTVYNADFTPETYKFLPFNRVIKHKLGKQHFDVALILDCSDSSRTGKVEGRLKSADCLINIDHHISNTYFGDLNWVEPKMSSASQMVYQLCRKLKIMDKDIALCLYTGIATDTGSFSYASTDYKTHQAISELMKYNISPDIIYRNLHSLCTLADLGFVGKIISSLKIDTQRRICWAVIKNWKDTEYDLGEIIFSLMRLLKNIDALILFKRVSKNRTRVNFRSNAEIDVNKVATFFGGGGHKRASGTTIEKPIEVAEKKVIDFIKRKVSNPKVRNKK